MTTAETSRLTAARSSSDAPTCGASTTGSDADWPPPAAPFAPWYDFWPADRADDAGPDHAGTDHEWCHLHARDERSAVVAEADRIAIEEQPRDGGGDEAGNGARVAKHSLRVSAYGTSDELNSFVGVARLEASGDLDVALSRIQNDLFDLGADLCRPDMEQDATAEYPPLRMIDAQVERLAALGQILQPLTGQVRQEECLVRLLRRQQNARRVLVAPSTVLRVRLAGPRACRRPANP